MMGPCFGRRRVELPKHWRAFRVFWFVQTSIDQHVCFWISVFDLKIHCPAEHAGAQNAGLNRAVAGLFVNVAII